MGLWVVVVIIVVVTGLVPSVILTRGPAILLVLVAAGIFRISPTIMRVIY